MLPGSNDGEYAAVNRLIAFVPCSVTVTHEGALMAHVAKEYASYCRFVAIGVGVFAAFAGVGFCVPQTLCTTSRNRRKFWTPVDVVTPGDVGGATPSSVVFVILKSGGPIGT